MPSRCASEEGPPTKGIACDDTVYAGYLRTASNGGWAMACAFRIPHCRIRLP
jgi:hypothetical protein